MPYRVVFQLNESASSAVEGVLGNIRHLQAELASAGLEVELVAHGDGLVAFYRAPNRQARTIREMAEQGVRFVACHNTMAARGLSPGDLLEVVQVVPSGVGELVRRQAEGWAYVHP